jgi:hypothetical protein
MPCSFPDREIVEYFCAGTTGHVVKLQTNYFRLPTVTNWQLYQYRVDFKPEEYSSAEKKRMVREFKEVLGGYLFDGTMFYTPHKYQKDVSLVYCVIGIAICTNRKKWMIILNWLLEK